METTLSGGFTFHHVGMAVPDIESAAAFYSEAFAFQIVSGPFEDPIQKVKVCFLGSGDGKSAGIELISPLSDASPVNDYLKSQKKGIRAYHVCYEVADIEKTVADLRSKGCLVMMAPVPAVAFGGRKIAWCYTPTQQVIELLEKAGLTAG